MGDRFKREGYLPNQSNFSNNSKSSKGSNFPDSNLTFSNPQVSNPQVSNPYPTTNQSPASNLGSTPHPPLNSNLHNFPNNQKSSTSSKFYSNPIHSTNPNLSQNLYPSTHSNFSTSTLSQNHIPSNPLAPSSISSGNSLFKPVLEAGILTAILADPTYLEEVVGILKPEDFYDPFHREVLRAMVALQDKGLPIDEQFLRSELYRTGSYDETRFYQLLTNSPLIGDQYLHRIKELAGRRRLTALFAKLNRKVIQEEQPLLEVVEEGQRELLQVVTDTTTTDFRSGGDVYQSTILQIEKRMAQGGQFLTGVDTGFYELNRKTGGFGRGDLIIIAARPSMGKTAFALNIATNLLRKGKGVAIFSLEMSAEQLMMRMVAAESRVSLQEIRQGNIRDEDWARIAQRGDFFKTGRLYFEDGGLVNIHTIRAKLRTLKTREPELELAIIDYLQLVGTKGRDRQLEIAEISRGLKLLARELEIPIVALSQLNRALESRPNKRPMLSDLRESGAIEQDADLILFIYRDGVYKQIEERKKMAEAREKGVDYQPKYVDKDPEEAEIIIGKQRNGPTGTIDMLFHKQWTLFTDRQKDEKVAYPSTEIVGAEVEEVPPAMDKNRNKNGDGN